MKKEILKRKQDVYDHYFPPPPVQEEKKEEEKKEEEKKEEEKKEEERKERTKQRPSSFKKFRTLNINKTNICLHLFEKYDIMYS